jgi:hypothetical protein
VKPLLILLSVVLLAGRSSPAAEPSAAPAPIDLSRWKLTLPIDAAGTVDGKASEVLPAELTAGYQHPECFVENDPDWANQSFYFKAGAYSQDNEGPPTEGARIVFTQLMAFHAEVANPATDGPRAAP